MQRLPLFVFGTLRRGQRNHHFLESRYDRVLPATLPGFRRVHPLMIERRPGHEVDGELFFLTPTVYEETMRGCDALEGLQPGKLTGKHYRRMQVQVRTPEGPCTAWAYPSADTPDE